MNAPGPVTISQAMAVAIGHHQAGRLAEAEAIYRQVLAVAPNHPDALHFLGVLAAQMGRHDLAVQMIRQSLALAPDNAAALSNYGEACRKQGQLDEAIGAYRRAIRLMPGTAAIQSNLGNALAERGAIDDSVAACREAIRLDPNFAEAWSNLGNALREKGALDEAIAACRRATELKPGYAEAHGNLGNALRDAGLLDAAISTHRRALSLKPRDPILLNNLAVALNERGLKSGHPALQADGRVFSTGGDPSATVDARREAVRRHPDSADAHVNLGNALLIAELPGGADAFRRAIELDPTHASAHANLAAALRKLGLFEEALAHGERAAASDPRCPIIQNTLGSILSELGQTKEAEAAFRKALELRPDYASAKNNLSATLDVLGQLDEAIATYRELLRLKPDYAEAWSNLGNALKDEGQLDEALACYRRAIELKPGDITAHSNLVYVAQFHPHYGCAALAGERARWARQHATFNETITPHANSPDPRRRLRVGYVSPDFRDHVIGRNLLPLFANHDRGEFEIICYSGTAPGDAFTDRFRSLADGWRSTLGVPDADLAATIRADGVDILVDLTQHMAGNRLAMFARRPAPVQISFAGYPDGTGLEAIGYRISDRHLDAGAPSSPAEKVFRIDSFWCYDPCGADVEINELPALANGTPPTFGCLNNFCKITDGMLALWARVLTQVEGSRLMILSPVGRHRARILELLMRAGVAAHRVEWVTSRPRKEYLEWYRRLDVVLDTFPYNGHTTTLDALWMGVPVVSLAGETPVSRAGLSILGNLGVPEWVAHSHDEFVRIAVGLANDLPALARWRATLRERMEASVLMDAPRFARNIEAAFRGAWEAWCATAESTMPRV